MDAEMDDAVLTWEIDQWGDLLVTKEDEGGSSMLRLGPLRPVIASLADFLKIAEGARGTRQIPASCDTHPKDGDVKQAPLESGAVPEGQTPNPSHTPSTEPPVE